MPNWAGMSKNLALWLLVLVLCVLLFQFVRNDRGETGELNYTEFSKQLESGNIKQVEIYDGELVKGDFRIPLAQGTGQLKSFTVRLPRGMIG